MKIKTKNTLCIVIIIALFLFFPYGWFAFILTVIWIIGKRILKKIIYKRD